MLGLLVCFKCQLFINIYIMFCGYMKGKYVSEMNSNYNSLDSAETNDETFLIFTSKDNLDKIGHLFTFTNTLINKYEWLRSQAKLYNFENKLYCKEKLKLSKLSHCENVNLIFLLIAFLTNV